MIRRLVSRLGHRISPQFAAALATVGAEWRTARIHRRTCRALRRLPTRSGLQLNLGCGVHRLEGFLHFDMTPGVDYRADLRQPLPLPDGCARCIFSEHFLEHLAYPGETDVFLGECRRLLEPGGELLLSVPDTEWPLKEYAAGNADYVEFCIRNPYFIHPECETPLEHINFHFRQRGRYRRESHFECHRYAYDLDTLRRVLERHGFAEIAARDFDPALDQESRRVGSLRIRAVKPIAPMQ